MKSGAPGHEERCPYCIDSDWVRRSHFRWYDAPLWVIGVSPYRCLTCYRRFYAFRGFSAQKTRSPSSIGN
jgi:transposase-like protein